MRASNPLLESALAYARFGWRVLPLHGIRPLLSSEEQARLTVTDQSVALRLVPKLGSRHYACTCKLGPECKTPGKHPRIRTGRAYAAATTDPVTITAWWMRWPNSNVGIATGHATNQERAGSISSAVPLGLLVVDIDGVKGVRALQDALRAAGLTSIPRTLQASSGRPDGGVHLYYRSQVCPQSSGNGLDTRGDGGLVVAPPSKHLSGAVYKWADLEQPLAVLDPAFAQYLGARERPDRPRKQNSDKFRQIPTNSDSLPTHLRSRKSKGVNAALKNAGRRPVPVTDIQAALAAIPNHDLGWDNWNRVLMAAWSCDQTEETLEACILWSRKSKKFTENSCEERWQAYSRSPPVELGFGTLWHLAKEACPDWQPPSHQATVVDPHSSSQASGTLDTAGIGYSGASEAQCRPLFTFPGGAQEAPAHQAAVVDPHSHDQGLSNASGSSIGVQGVAVGTPAFPLLGDSQAQHSPGNGHPLNGHVNGHHLPQFTQATPSNPLIDLNNRYQIIRNIGRKMVMSMEPSEEDPSIRIPYFQPCSDFREGYSSTYLSTPQDPDPKQLGAYWLKWTGRKTYDGLDLIPNKPKVLTGNVLNLWDGFACRPAPGSWATMQDHIFSVLAGGDNKAAEYIWRWMAWAVQHPGERAEIALVLRGGKGVGKGRFATWMKRLFGQHGLQIANSRHLTGNFNGHLRSCLLLFVDEAFWAGDKQGESILKTLLTEASFMLEQKGVDAKGWRNRLHVIMAANAEWVVPASSDERRYAVFDVADKRARDYDYFHMLETEMANGGLPAMLYDLLQVKLESWHPRQGIQTRALQSQKARSLDPRHEWLESLLQQGELPTVHTPTGEYVCAAATLLGLVRDAGGRGARDITANALGRFLNSWSCTHIHRSQGSAWRFPPLQDLRKAWEIKYGSWLWDIDLRSWNERNNLT